MSIVQQVQVVLNQDDNDHDNEAFSSPPVMMMTKCPTTTTHSISVPVVPRPGIQKDLQRPSATARTDDSSSFRATTAEEAHNLIENRFENSQFGKNVKDLPRFNMLELELGRRLGKGGFSNVDEIRGIYLREDIKSIYKKGVYHHSRMDSEAINDIENRQFIATHCDRRNGDSRYAMKKLRNDISDSPDRLLLGLCDLVVETRLLSSLAHPCIIKLRAISDADPYSTKYFLVLDRLYDTLQTRLKKWSNQHRTCNSILNRLMKDRLGIQKQQLFEERLVYAFDLSAALQYLHSNNIIHRDIKPENIGFDVRDDIKIFDFGMAKELRKENYNKNDGCYCHMSKMTGTPRYMAPEVFLGQRYNASVDVYSYAIMLWEIMALQLPFGKIKGQQNFANRVVEGGHRPPIKKNSSIPKAVRDIMQKSWSAKWQDRYTMAEILDVLRKELVALRDGDDTGLEHLRRRSTDVFCPTALQTVREGLDLSGKSDTRDSYASTGSRSLGRTILLGDGGTHDNGGGPSSARVSAASSRSSGQRSSNASSMRSSGQRFSDISLRSSGHRFSDLSSRSSGQRNSDLTSRSSSSGPPPRPSGNRFSGSSPKSMHKISEQIELDVGVVVDS